MKIDLGAIKLYKLDAVDREAVLSAIRLRLSVCDPDGTPIMPEGTPADASGAIAEICRGWLEMVGRLPRRDPPVLRLVGPEGGGA